MSDQQLQIKIVADARQAAASIGEASRAMNGLAQNVEAAQANARTMAEAFIKGQIVFQMLGDTVRKVFLDLPKAMLDGAIAAEKLQKAFTVLEGSADAAARQIAFVRNEANRLGIPLAEASDAWLKLAAAARGTALEGEDARRIFSAVAGAASTLGLSANETSGALLAISQMMSKGTVQAEELRGQLGERLPGAFQIAARAMGVSTSALGEMLDRGEILASDFLPRFAAQLAKEIPASADGVQNAINRMGNATEEWRRLTGSALAVAIDGFFGLKQAMGELGSDDRIVERARLSAKAIAALIDVVRELVLFVPNVLKTIGGSVAAVARDIKFAFDVAAAALTEGVGEKGRAAMKRALDERNAFIAAYNEDMQERWFPKQLATRVDEFFADYAKRQASGAAQAARYFEGELTKEQQKTIDAIRSKEEKLAAEYKAHAANLYAALTSGALSIDDYNKQRAKLQDWYEEQQSKLGVTRLPSLARTFDAELAALKASLKTAEDVLEAALRARLLKEEDYWQAKGAMQRQALEAEARELAQKMAEQQRLVSALQATKPKDANQKAELADRLREAQNRLAELKVQMDALDGRRMVVDLEVQTNLERVRREIEDLKAGLRERIAQAQGTMTPDMLRAAVEREFRDTLQRLAADAEGEQLVAKAIDVEAAKRQLSELEAQWNLVTGRLQNAQEAIRIQQQAGLLTEYQARQQIVALQLQAAAEMQRLLPTMQQAAQAIGPQAELRVQSLRNELERTRQVADELAPVWNKIGEGFAGSLQGIVTGAQSMREALANIFKSIGDAFLQHMVLQPLQQWVAMQARMLAMKLGFIQQEQTADAAASAAKIAQKSAETTAVVSMDAAKAGAGAAASQASIPVVGPGLALAAMAAMVAAVMALMGNVKKFATGGYVSGPGTSTSDSIPARLSAGEYVVRADAVRRVGVAFLDAINGLSAGPRFNGAELAFAAGGLVPAVQTAAPAQVNNAIRIVNAIDPDVTHDHLQSPAGERVILNIIGRNARAVRAALQG